MLQSLLRSVGLAPPVWSCKGKSVMITGASSGIGEALALKYAKDGAGRIWLVARRKDRLEDVKKTCLAVATHESIEIPCVVADVAVEDGWSSIRNALDAGAGGEEKPLDLLVLNAGVSMGTTFEQAAAQNEAMPIMKRLMDVNYLGAVGCYDAALPALQKSEQQRVLVVSSVLGLVGTPMRTGYAGSKFALRGFFDALRCELLASGGVITVAYPGAVSTEINSSRLGQGSTDLVMDRALTPEACARAMADAHAGGARDVFFGMDNTFKGWFRSKTLTWVNFLFPAVADRLIVQSMGIMTKAKEQ